MKKEITEEEDEVSKCWKKHGVIAKTCRNCSAHGGLMTSNAEKAIWISTQARLQHVEEKEWRKYRRKTKSSIGVGENAIELPGNRSRVYCRCQRVKCRTVESVRVKFVSGAGCVCWCRVRDSFSFFFIFQFGRFLCCSSQSQQDLLNKALEINAEA